jgi:hypothetical protein
VLLRCPERGSSVVSTWDTGGCLAFSDSTQRHSVQPWRAFRDRRVPPATAGHVDDLMTKPLMYLPMASTTS